MPHVSLFMASIADNVDGLPLVVVFYEAFFKVKRGTLDKQGNTNFSLVGFWCFLGYALAPSIMKRGACIFFADGKTVNQYDRAITSNKT